MLYVCFFFFSSRRRHTRLQGDWSSDVCSSDLYADRACASVLLLGEDVAGAADREDATRPLRVVLDGRADARDVDVDRAVEGLERLAPDEIHEGGPREHAARLLGEGDEQRELVAGEAPFHSVHPHGAGVAIDLEPAKAQHVRCAAGLAPAEDRA